MENYKKLIEVLQSKSSIPVKYFSFADVEKYQEKYCSSFFVDVALPINYEKNEILRDKFYNVILDKDNKIKDYNTMNEEQKAICDQFYDLASETIDKNNELVSEIKTEPEKTGYGQPRIHTYEEVGIKTTMEEKEAFDKVILNCSNFSCHLGNTKFEKLFNIKVMRDNFGNAFTQKYTYGFVVDEKDFMDEDIKSEWIFDDGTHKIEIKIIDIMVLLRNKYNTRFVFYPVKWVV
jgi:hypothetical protein